MEVSGRSDPHEIKLHTAYAFLHLPYVSLCTSEPISQHLHALCRCFRSKLPSRRIQPGDALRSDVPCLDLTLIRNDAQRPDDVLIQRNLDDA
jgi:hypothetical protein